MMPSAASRKSAMRGARRGLEGDLALVRLMLDGGLRPGEALGLHLSDVAYGRRRVTIRHREDHPRGVRQKSRTERVVAMMLTIVSRPNSTTNSRPICCETLSSRRAPMSVAPGRSEATERPLGGQRTK